jgi:hypothetical protein
VLFACRSLVHASCCLVEMSLTTICTVTAAPIYTSLPSHTLTDAGSAGITSASEAAPMLKRKAALDLFSLFAVFFGISAHRFTPNLRVRPP